MACGPDGGDGSPSDAARPPNVLLISVDTLRADRLGCYGADRPTSPFLDELAADGARFARCFAPAPNTAPSHMSIMTSLHPSVHGVTNSAPRERLAHPAATPHLAELLREAGYATAGFTDGGPTTSSFGFGPGFDVYDSTYEGVEEKVARALAWLDARPDDAPFFLFLHTYEVHAPYLPPIELHERFVPPYEGELRRYVFDEAGRVRSRHDGGFHEVWSRSAAFDDDDVAFLRGLYDGGIAHTDAALRRLVDALGERALRDDTLIVLLSDHGEEFGEHGAFSHKQLHREVLHVPLLVSGPGVREGLVVERPVSLLDVAPTLLGMLGLPVPAHFEGLDLTRALRAGNPPPAARPLFAELVAPGAPPVSSALRLDDALLIRRRLGAPPLSLYDLARDPGETRPLDLSGSSQELARLRERLASWAARCTSAAERHAARPADAAAETPEEVLEELRQLGY